MVWFIHFSTDDRQHTASVTPFSLLSGLIRLVRLHIGSLHAGLIKSILHPLCSSRIKIVLDFHHYSLYKSAYRVMQPTLLAEHEFHISTVPKKRISMGTNNEIQSQDGIQSRSINTSVDKILAIILVHSAKYVNSTYSY